MGTALKTGMSGLNPAAGLTSSFVPTSDAVSLVPGLWGRGLRKEAWNEVGVSETKDWLWVYVSSLDLRPRVQASGSESGQQRLELGEMGKEHGCTRAQRLASPTAIFPKLTTSLVHSHCRPLAHAVPLV